MQQTTTKLTQQPKNEVKQLRVITEPESTTTRTIRTTTRAD